MSEEEKQLCFVWGAPMSGQLRWIAQAVENTDEHISVAVQILGHVSPSPSLESWLKDLKVLLDDDSAEGPRHIYCELPWDAITEDLTLEEWLQENAVGWNAGFVCLCPPDADRLPKVYREGLEEFARASQSAVMVVQEADTEEKPEWLNTDVLDFGEQLEVFVDPMWPENDEKAPKLKALPDREMDVKSYDMDPSKAEKFMKELHEAGPDQLWGAEAFWLQKNSRELVCISLAHGQLYKWTTDFVALTRFADAKTAVVNISGFDLEQST